MAKWAIESGKKFGYNVSVLEKQQLKSQKLDALLAVGQGSEHPPVLIVMEYRSPNATQTVGLVGKGVTFDTGGISIKSSTNMHLMKSDMGGAAAVFGAMELAAKMQLPINLIGIVPACENSVDGKSFKPSDVINSYSGKTIEIIDTDAEGRLILADGLSYMVKNFQPDVMIDLATLTGSVIATLGYHAAGMFTNNDNLAQKLTQAADQTGERLWRLPLWDIYKEDISSDIADVRNYSGKPMAGAISATKFLEVFTENHQNWAHLDIAGTAYGDTEFAPQRAGTAFGVRLLLEYLENMVYKSE
jgi:leucyl aminopeptidase